MSKSRTIGAAPGNSRAVDISGAAVNQLNRGTMSCDARLISLAASIVTLRDANYRQTSRMLFNGLLILVIGAVLGTVTARAQNATWLSSPGSGNWNTASNWQPTIVPIQTAIFGTSNITALTFSNNTSVGTLQFNTGAPAYTFDLSGGIGLTITKTGIVNNSSNAPTFFLTTISSVPAALTFQSGSTAGNAAIGGSGTIGFFNSTAGNATINASHSLIQFGGGSTAGDASITNTFGKMTFFGRSSGGNAIIQNDEGSLTFFDSSTAGAATITNNSGDMTFADRSSAGNASIRNADSTTTFIDRSTAGNASITNLGDLVFADASTAGHAAIHDNGGSTSFNDTSSAGNASIFNQQNGQLTFNDTSSAGNAIITNSSNLFFGDRSSAGKAAISGSGTVGFFTNSTAARATINTTRALIEFGGGSSAGDASITNTFGTMTFRGTSSAGNAIIQNDVGSLTFFDSSTAGAATITNNSGSMTFADMSTAAKASITNADSTTMFIDRSTAANATITNFSALIFADASTAGHAAIHDNGGSTSFNDTSTAGNASIFNQQNGQLTFNDSSSAGKAVITNSSGNLFFVDQSTAGNATITTGSGGLTAFYNTSTGDQARFITRAGGIFDISNLTSAGMTVGSIQGAGTYRLGSKTLTVGLNNLNTRVSGAIVDGGSNGGTGGALVKDGTGTLTLSGLDTYSGGTVINLGTLIVASAQALGTGDVTVNGGLLRADPQIINVRGNYTQNAGGTLQLQLGANPGQYDSLNVGGNAALGGTLQLISLGFQPKAGNQLTLITTGGTVSGRFAQFVDPFTTGPGFNTVDLVYGRKSVRLEFLNLATPIKSNSTRQLMLNGQLSVLSQDRQLSSLIVTTDFSSFAVTPSQLPTAKLLDAVQMDPKATDFISFLNQEPFANLPNDLQKISPEALTAFYEITFSNANIQRLNLESRMDDLHVGSNGFSSNMTLNGATANLEDRTDADGKSSKATVEPVLQHTSENRWGVWVTGFGDFVSVDGDANAKGYNFTTGGVSVGVDYRISDELAIGVMGDYSHTWTSLQPSGNIDVNSGRGGLYATWYHHGFYLDAAIYAGHNSYNSSRSGLGGLADGNTGGTEWSTFLSGGYDFQAGPLTVGPIAALQYTYANVNGFTENGSLAPMQIESNSVDSLRTDVGFRLFYQWKIGKVLLEPSLKATWEHEYLYSALPITAGFAGISGPTTTFSGPSEGHNSAILSTGVSAQWTPALTVYLNYDGQLGRGNYNSNAVTGGVRVGF
jgi:outer membrane autotransporter protein